MSNFNPQMLMFSSINFHIENIEILKNSLFENAWTYIDWFCYSKISLRKKNYFHIIMVKSIS